MTDTLDLAHHVGGADVPAPAVLEQCNPAAPDDLVVRTPEADLGLVQEAVSAARRALSPLDRAGVEARADTLASIARALAAQADDLALLVTRETGKTLTDAKGEVLRSARIFEFFAGETIRNVGERFASTRPGAMVEVERAPVGVVAAVTPWNFPRAIPAWKIAPALAFGDTVVWKPSELSSATAAALMRLIAASGLPAGAVNMVLGGGSTGAALSAAPGVDAITFTGSGAAGAAVRREAMERGVRVQLEMGGVNGLIVMDDADLDNAVDCALNGAFFAAGQRCTATSRIIVHEAIAERFTAALSARAQALPIGDPRDPKTVIGPLIAPRHKARVAEQVRVIENAISPRFGGSAVELPFAFYPPTLFCDADPKGPLGQEEIFGPVAGVFQTPDLDAALALLNGVPYGLSAGICTRSLASTEAFKRSAQAGMLMINLPTAGVDYHAPFGGLGASSYGPREQGRAAREFYTVVRTAYQKPL